MSQKGVAVAADADLPASDIATELPHQDYVADVTLTADMIAAFDEGRYEDFDRCLDELGIRSAEMRQIIAIAIGSGKALRSLIPVRVGSSPIMAHPFLRREELLEIAASMPKADPTIGERAISVAVNALLDQNDTQITLRELEDLVKATKRTLIGVA